MMGSARAVFLFGALASAVLGCELIAGLEDKEVVSPTGGAGTGGTGGSGAESFGGGGSGAAGGAGGGIGGMNTGGCPDAFDDPCAGSPMECMCSTGFACPRVVMQNCAPDARDLFVNEAGVFWTTATGLVVRAPHNGTVGMDYDYVRIPRPTPSPWSLDISCKKAFITTDKVPYRVGLNLNGAFAGGLTSFAQAIPDDGPPGRGIAIDPDDDENIFFITGAQSEGSLYRSDGQLVTEIAPAGSGIEILIEGNYVYYPSALPGQGLSRLLKTSTSPPTTTEVVTTDSIGLRLVATGDYLYYVNSSDRILHRRHLPSVGQTGDGEPLFETGGDAIAADTDYVYFIDAIDTTVVARVSITDLNGSPEIVAQTAAGRNVFDMEVFNNTLYIINNNTDSNEPEDCPNQDFVPDRAVERVALPSP